MKRLIKLRVSDLEKVESIWPLWSAIEESITMADAWTKGGRAGRRAGGSGEDKLRSHRNYDEHWVEHMLGDQYESALNEPVPQDMLDLVERIAQSDRSATRSEEPKAQREFLIRRGRFAAVTPPMIGTAEITSEITSPLVRSFFAYWEGLRADRLAPSWMEIEPGAIKNCLPYLLVAEVFGEPFDLRYRLTGTEVVASYGFDPTSKTLRGYDYGPSGTSWVALYGELLSQKHPIFGRYVARVGLGEIFRVDTVTLPLSHDGRSVDRIIELEDWSKLPGIRRYQVDPNDWRFETLD